MTASLFDDGFYLMIAILLESRNLWLWSLHPFNQHVDHMVRNFCTALKLFIGVNTERRVIKMCVGIIKRTTRL